MVGRASLRRRRWLAHCVAAMSVCFCGLLYFYPPSQGSFYPVCPIHAYLHFDCPGCGMTRAIASLLHGRAGEALHFNALAFVLLPIGLAGAMQAYGRAIRRGEFRWPAMPLPAAYAVLAGAVAFTLLRNGIL